MIEVSVSKSQMNKVDKALRKVVRQNKAKAKDAIEIAGFEMESIAAQEAPVDTSRLRQSIKNKTEDKGYAAVTSTRVHYAKFQEFGTWKITGKHFMQAGYNFGVLAFMNAIKR